MELKIVGIDLAKSVFHLHGVNARGKALLRKRLSRAQLLPFLGNLPRCTVAMEACGSAHYWAREVERLGQIEGVGPLTATALVAAVGNGQAFSSGRYLSAWLGLVPRQYSTAGRPGLANGATVTYGRCWWKGRVQRSSRRRARMISAVVG
jgi:transposase